MVTVRQTGGDYSSLKAAIDASETVIDIEGTWTVADSFTGTLAIALDTTITCDSFSQNAGRPHQGAETTYRLRKTDAGHVFTVSSNATLTMVGLDVQHAAAVTSDENIRLSSNACTVIARRCGFGYHQRQGGNQCDVLYLAAGNGITQVEFENCFFYNGDRAVVGYTGANVGAGSTVKVNSCSAYDCGTQLATVNSWEAFIAAGGSAAITISVFNLATEHCRGATSGSLIMQATPTNSTLNGDWIIHNLASLENGFGTTNVTNNLPSRTWTDNGSPGAGAWVICTDLTSTIPDLTLFDNATDNDAQDAHTTASGAGLTMPATDCKGTTRPQNTDYDAGSDEVETGTGAITLFPTAADTTTTSETPIPTGQGTATTDANEGPGTTTTTPTTTTGGSGIVPAAIGETPGGFTTTPTPIGGPPPGGPPAPVPVSTPLTTGTTPPHVVEVDPSPRIRLQPPASPTFTSTPEPVVTGKNAFSVTPAVAPNTVTSAPEPTLNQVFLEPEAARTTTTAPAPLVTVGAPPPTQPAVNVPGPRPVVIIHVGFGDGPVLRQARGQRGRISGTIIGRSQSATFQAE